METLLSQIYCTNVGTIKVQKEEAPSKISSQVPTLSTLPFTFKDRTRAKQEGNDIQISVEVRLVLCNVFKASNMDEDSVNI